MYNMVEYEYYEAEIGNFEQLELFHKMVELFEDIEIVDIYDDEIVDEEGYKIQDIWVVRVKQDKKKYNGLSEVLIRGFDMDLVEVEA